MQHIVLCFQIEADRHHLVKTAYPKVIFWLVNVLLPAGGRMF